MKIIITIIVALFISTGLVKSQDTLYMYKAGLVMNKRAVVDMDSVTFTYTPPATGTVIDIDGNTYHWIKIGTQTWMVENLKTTKFRTGESISNIQDPTTWGASTFSAWCDYNNDQTNGIKYGKLYNWYAVNDNRSISPVGWHIPTDSEWTTLENFLISNGGNYDGTFTGNKIAKSLAAKTDWTTNSILGTIGNNLSLNNSSGFSALPGGCRYSNGISYSIGDKGCWWSTTSYNSNNAWFMSMFNGTNYVSEGNYDGYKLNGYSVRCIKD